jgi:nucleotide-binding universal stress UspA family protein
LEEKTRALSAAAKKAGVEFIVLQTKATSGLKRLVLGSFAETFLLNATVPILLIPPDVRRLSRPRKVLFSTDLSAASFLAFKRVCPTLKGLNAKVVLYYHLELPESTLQMLKSRERSLIDLDKVIESAKPALEEKAQDFLELALCYQINAAFKIGADLRLISKAEAILETAEELDIDCIALASQSGKLATSFIGATSRSVARAAKCPVLIYRTGD